MTKTSSILLLIRALQRWTHCCCCCCCCCCCHTARLSISSSRLSRPRDSEMLKQRMSSENNFVSFSESPIFRFFTKTSKVGQTLSRKMIFFFLKRKFFFLVFQSHLKLEPLTGQTFVNYFNSAVIS